MGLGIVGKCKYPTRKGTTARVAREQLQGTNQDSPYLLGLRHRAANRACCRVIASHTPGETRLRTIEIADGREVVQYRGRNFDPLIRLNDVLGVPSSRDRKTRLFDVIVQRA